MATHGNASAPASTEARLGLYHCLRQLAGEAAVLDLPDAMLAIARAASLVRVAITPEPRPSEPGQGSPLRA